MMLKKHLLLVWILALMFSCQSVHISKIEGQRLTIDEALGSDKTIETFIKPYRDRINKTLDSVISYSPTTYTKNQGELNTGLGNLMADAVYDEANPIFKQRTGKEIDFVLLNHGGIRSIISKGAITPRTAYALMPFENSVVVVALKGSQINELFLYLSKAKRAHPVSKQLKLTLNPDYKVSSALIHGSMVDENKTYYVATNDYLFNGGDSMIFFQSNVGVEVLNYKVRNVLIDHFKKTDTLKAKRDHRFIKLKS